MLTVVLPFHTLHKWATSGFHANRP